MTQATQHESMTAVAEQLREAENSRVTLTIDGEEYTGYLGHIDYAPFLRDDSYSDKGEIDATFELENEEVERRGFKTGVVGILATEERPGEWTEPHASLWDPVVEDGTVVSDEYRTLGTVEKVEKSPDGGS